MSFGLYSALMPRRPVTHQLSLISFTTCCGALMLVPFSVWEYSTGATLKFDFLTLATLVYVLIFPSTLAYLFFNRGLALIGPNRAAPFFHLVPVFGSAMAIVLLGEQLQLFHLIGYALVLAGVVIASRRASAQAVNPQRLRTRRHARLPLSLAAAASLPANQHENISEGNETMIALLKRYRRAAAALPLIFALASARRPRRPPIRAAPSRWCCRSPPAAAPTPRRASSRRSSAPRSASAW